jgi:plastocyanin
MRKALWSPAALVALSVSGVLLIGPTVQAAETVTMGSNDGFTFSPKEITVPVGATVVWRNLSAVQHDARADNGSFASPLLDKGKEYSFTFNTPGEVTYFCTVSGHRDAGMEGVVKVTGGGATPAPPVSSTTTTAKPAAGGATATTAAAAGQSTTTTTPKGAAGGSTTTTTAGGGVTSTTQAASVTPTSAPETGGVTTTTAPTGAAGAEAAAGGEHAGGDSTDPGDDKSSPLGIAFAAISTALLAAISGKLLASRS